MNIDLTIAKKFIESLYVDACNVYEFQHVVDETTGITSQQEVLVHENVPCKLSFNKFSQTGDGVGGSLSFLARIFLSPDLEIKEGSKIVVAKNGKTYILANSGVPRMGINHQEIIVETWDKWA